MNTDNPIQNDALPPFSFSLPALQVLRSGNITLPNESPEEMVQRVLNSIFSIEANFGTSQEEIRKIRRQFADYMSMKLVMLGSPMLTNAGRSQSSALGSCVAIPVDLNQSFRIIEPIINAYYEQNMGSGFDLSDVDDPVGVLTLLNNHAVAQTEAAKYDRYIGNMANLAIHHPRIQDFIMSKKKNRQLRHFNCSISVTDEFMSSLECNSHYTLRNGRKIKSQKLWNDIIQAAWECGDPGLLFLERFNADNPTPSVGKYITTAPCAEVGLSLGESCIFGYVNLGQYVRLDASNNETFDYRLLEEVVITLTRVLDNALESSISRYPTIESTQVMRAKRKIGIGICGFADLLIRLQIPYESSDASLLIQNILIAITYHSKRASIDLAQKRGSFTALSTSRYMQSNGFLEEKYCSLDNLRVGSDEWKGLAEYIRRSGHLRHASTTALPPSGRTARLVDASNSLEPWFSLYDDYGTLKPQAEVCVRAMYKNCRPHSRHLHDNPIDWSKHGSGANPMEGDTHVDQIINALRSGSSSSIDNYVPEAVKNVLKCATQIHATGHLEVLHKASQCVDEGASKTINLPSGATITDVDYIFKSAWKKGLKAMSIYRDGTAPQQPEQLTTNSNKFAVK